MLAYWYPRVAVLTQGGSHLGLSRLMSGTGRRSAYRKHITDNVLNSFPTPNAEAGEVVAQVIQSRGGNILQVRRGAVA
jgi:hypothetical protein